MSCGFANILVIESSGINTLDLLSIQTPLEHWDQPLLNLSSSIPMTTDYGFLLLDISLKKLEMRIRLEVCYNFFPKAHHPCVLFIYLFIFLTVMDSQSTRGTKASQSVTIHD